MSKRKRLDLDLKVISPLTINQAKVLDSDKDKVLHGSAGTGKTFLAMYKAFEAVKNNEVDKIVIIRSTVATRDIGFLPGNEEEKAKVYERPYPPIAAELFDRGDAYGLLKHKGQIEFEITSFLRGTTFSNCFIIVDEIQNMTFHELDTIMTRRGKNCKMILCGDYRQADTKNGLKKFLDIIKTMKSYNFVEFTRDDIVRDESVKEYIIAKEIYEEGGSK